MSNLAISTRKAGRPRLSDAEREQHHERAVEVGWRIREYREAADLNQADLARLIGVYPQQISNYEQGRGCPSADILLRLSDALEVDPGTLWGRPTGGTALTSWQRGYYEGYRAALKAMGSNIRALRSNVKPPKTP